MYQIETDSEDDYECLFLKPVDGYNINDRIKQANEELFASPGPNSPLVAPRKVTFRKVLEEFDDGGDNISILSIESLETVNVTDQKKFNEKLKNIPEIIENKIDDEDDEINAAAVESDTEEICEEIIELKLDTGLLTVPNQILPPNQLIKNELTNTKQIVTNPIETIPKISSPKLPTLQEERDSSIKFQEISLDSPSSSLDKTTTISPSSSEDDLSVIASSYIPDGLEIIEEKSTDTNTKDGEKLKKKKFSFRRKKKITSPQKQSNKNSKQTNTNKIDIKNNENNENELKFYYKNCCEYKNAVDTNATLPKYTGYLSEYGLSAEQLKKRQKKLEKQKEMILEKNLKASESEIQKMGDNERAFTRWLKNKMKYPVNKTKNMFDFHQNKNAKKIK